jgi:hypothetical protein
MTSAEAMCPQCGRVLTADAPIIDGVPVCPHCQHRGLVPQPEESGGAEVSAVRAEHRPWIRYWARMIDISIFSVLLSFGLAFVAPTLLAQPPMTFSMLVLLLWVFVESMFLDLINTTPGKWLLRIQISHPNGTPVYSNWLVRSFKVWLKGFAMGFVIVSLFTLAFAHKRLMRDGVTSWDREGGFLVTHERIGALRLTVATVYTALYLLLTLVPMFTAQPEGLGGY